MNNDNNDNLNFLERTKEIALGIYILLLFLIFIFPPMNEKVELKITTVPTGLFYDVFVGWENIFRISTYGYSINKTYLLIEIIVLTLLYRGLLWIYISGHKKIMNNNDNFNLNNQEIKKIALVVYVVVLILIFLFPPMNRVSGSNSLFAGWSFISDLGVTLQVNIPYLLVEMGMATVVYIFFLISQKK